MQSWKLMNFMRRGAELRFDKQNAKYRKRNRENIEGLH